MNALTKTSRSDLRLVSINGSPRFPSRTGGLVQLIGGSIAQATGAQWRHFDMTAIAGEIMTVLTRDKLSAAGEAIIREVESADVILLGSPVYRASFTGAVKHLFDLVHYEALRGRVAAVCATGGNRHHGLVTEHQLRPLMSFFGMITVPTAIFAEEADFDGYAVVSDPIRDRIERMTNDVVRLVGAPHHATPASAALSEEVLP